MPGQSEFRSAHCTVYSVYLQHDAPDYLYAAIPGHNDGSAIKTGPSIKSSLYLSLSLSRGFFLATGSELAVMMEGGVGRGGGLKIKVPEDLPQQPRHQRGSATAATSSERIYHSSHVIREDQPQQPRHQRGSATAATSSERISHSSYVIREDLPQ